MKARSFTKPVAVLFAAIVIADLAVPAGDAERWTLHEEAFDLIAAVPLLAVLPLLVIAGHCSRTHRWRVVLAGSYGYIVYSLLIYSLDALFGPVFYCATLGLATFGLITV